MSTSGSQCLPDRRAHVLAIDLGHLFSQQWQALERWDICQQPFDIHLASPIGRLVIARLARIGREACNGAAGAQNYDFFAGHLHFPKNWLKIQPLDIKTVSSMS